MNKYISGLPATLFCIVLLATVPVAARQAQVIEIDADTEVDVRVFESQGTALLLGFACDEGHSVNQEVTAEKLSHDGIDVWMPDLLGAYFLPKLPSSIAEIPADATIRLVERAWQSKHKDIYLLAGGRETELVLRTLATLEASGKGHLVKGAILLFPRLLDGEPVPGQAPRYVDAVGKTRSRLMVIEGERTPNRWGLSHLKGALAQGGSAVQTLVVPDVRGFFYTRGDANPSEHTVTEQLHGLIKAAVYQLEHHL